MRNLQLILAFIVMAGVSFSQSKKEQIEQLSYRVDSLNQLVISERKANSQKNSDLNAKITILERNIIELNTKLSNVTNEKQAEISSLQTLIRIKTDSLILVQLELNQLKPKSVIVPVKVVINNQEKQSVNNETVTIGTQVWTAKNLDVSTYRNGDVIPQVQDADKWQDLTTGAWCYYNNDTSNGTIYGKLYNWYAVNDPRGLAPVGYHIPSDAEWTILTDYLGNEYAAGTKMKMSPVFGPTITSYVDQGGYYQQNWVSCSNCKVASSEYKKICPKCKGTQGRIVQGKYVPKTKKKVETKGTRESSSWDGDNLSGFSALPGGHRLSDGHFYGFRDGGYWWNSAESIEKYDWGISLAYGNGKTGRNRGYDHENMGLSVRCVKD